MGSASSAPHPQGKTMQGVGFSKYGDIDALDKIDVPYPHGFDASRNVVIKVHASSINPIDKILLTGGLKMMKPVKAFPHIICYDAAGVVEVADTKGTLAVGDEVMVRLFGDRTEDGKKVPWYRGAMAEYCVARVSDVARKPANVSFEEAASIPLAGMTAYQAFKNMGLKEGESVFITGGAGGVGTLAIQLAKHVFKAKRVVTTASAGPKAELCKSLGADEVVDYKSSNFEEVYGADDAEKFDVCFDTTGESQKLTKVAKEGSGRVITISGTPTLEAMRLAGNSSPLLKLFLKSERKREEYKSGAARGVSWKYLFLTPSGQDLQDLSDYLKDGTIKPVLDNIWDFDSSDEKKTGWKGAFDTLFSGRAKGKCVVRMVKA